MRHALGIALLVLSLSMLGGCLEGLFFHPDSRHWGTPREAGLRAEDVTIAGPDAKRLHGWLLPAASPARGTVLHVHGNAANIGNHLPLVAWLPAAGWNVLLFDYRGFGKSEGKPSLDGVVADTRAALEWLRKRPGIDPARIVVVGQSLGGATALRVVADDRAQQPVRGLVVDSSFASYRGIAREAAGALKLVVAPLIAGLPGDASDPVTAARRITVPLLVMHGSADRMIDIADSKAIHDAAPGPRKQWFAVPGAGHLDAFMREDVRGTLIGWLNAL